MKYSNKPLYVLSAQKAFYKWEVEILASSSLKSAYHVSTFNTYLLVTCGQEPRLPFSIHWETFHV